MARTKISEFSATPGNNTDIDGINLAEGCAPSGINDAIRELMSQLKDFQAGTAGDSFNGPVGTTTAAAGAFTTLSASSTVSGTGFSNYLASPPAIGGTAAAAGSFTTLTTSSTVTHNGGTANGVAYLNGSKVLTTGSALTFDGSTVGVFGGTTVGYRFNANRGTDDTSQGLRLGFSGIDSYRTAATLSQPQTAINFTQTGSNGTRTPYYIDSDGNSIWSPGTGTSPSEQMRLTSTGLGIGTSSPAAKLDVTQSSSGSVVTALMLRNPNSTVAGTGTKIYFSSVPGNNRGSYIESANTTSGNDTYLAFGTNSVGADATERMRLDSSGNLGLGVTPSAWSGYTALQVNNAISLWTSAGSSVYLSNNVYTDGVGRKYVFNGYASEYQSGGGAHYWKTAASGTAGNAITFTQAMTLDASGNLGVGATSPAATLDVSVALPSVQVKATTGTNRVWFRASNTGGDFYIGRENSAGNAFGVTAYSSLLWSQGAYPMVFATDGTERARIDSSGNLLVQTADAAISSGVGIKLKPNSTAPQVSVVGSDSTDGSQTLFVYSTGASAYRFYVGFGGTVYATSTTISAISDIRYKENVRDLDVGLDAVMALKPRLYDWKEGKGANIKNARGFIAQEFEQVFPDLIDEWKDPAPEGEEPYKSVRQDLIPVLVKAIQEQQAIIETLTARVAALESK